MPITNTIDQLKRDEGFCSEIYTDTVGKRTVGYGHNLDANPIPDLVTPITKAYGEQILGKDVDRVSTALVHSLSWVVSLDEARLGVLQNMCFNMGIEGLLGFHNMLTCLQSGLYQSAADDMKASKWYTQVGDRAVRLVQQMRTGVWQ